MPKIYRHRHKRRTLRGGELMDTSGQDWFSSITQGATNLWQKTKDSTSSLLSGTTTSSPVVSTTQSYNQPMTTSTYGGKTKRRHMRGGFTDNIALTGLAAHAAPFSGKTAEPHNLVGGKTKRRRRKGGKSRRHRRH